MRSRDVSSLRSGIRNIESTPGRASSGPRSRVRATTFMHVVVPPPAYRRPPALWLEATASCGRFQQGGMLVDRVLPGFAALAKVTLRRMIPGSSQRGVDSVSLTLAPRPARPPPHIPRTSTARAYPSPCRTPCTAEPPSCRRMPRAPCCSPSPRSRRTRSSAFPRSSGARPDRSSASCSHR